MVSFNYKLFNRHITAFIPFLFKSYGWIPGPFAKYDERDMRLLFRPQVKSDITRVGELIEHEKITARPYYTGVPFRVVF